jgi:hypothetical protein
MGISLIGLAVAIVLLMFIAAAAGGIRPKRRKL